MEVPINNIQEDNESITEGEEMELGLGDQLPIEILLQIFSHLDVDDIKSVKLVCKNWLQATQYPKIGAKLKLKFSYLLLESELPRDVFRNTYQNYYNVEITESAANIFISFFNSIGESLKSVHINTLNFASDVELFEILQDMKNIHELKLENCSFERSHGINYTEIFSNLQIIKILNRSTTTTNFAEIVNILGTLPQNKISSFTLNFVYKVFRHAAGMKQLLLMINNNKKTLTKLNLYECCFINTEISNNFWKALKDCQCTLKSLSVSHISEPSIEFIDFLLSQKNLTCLKLKNVHTIKDEHMKLFVDSLQHLQTIELKNCVNISNTGIKSLDKLKSLKQLTIECRDESMLNCSSILQGIAKTENLNIIKLDLTCVDFTMETLQNITKNLPRLEILKCSDLLHFPETIDDDNEKDNVSKILENCCNLKELYWINHRKRVRRLRNNNLQSITSENLSCSINENTLVNLELLEITDLNVYIKIFDNLNLPNLKVLRILNGTFWSDFMYTDIIPIFSRKCKLIEHLMLKIPIKMDETFDIIIKSFPKLKSLRFWWHCGACDYTRDLLVQFLRVRKQTQPNVQANLNTENNDQYVTKTRCRKRKYFPLSSGECSRCEAFFTKLREFS